uniref:Uncharacterized protein n=1 Tax=Tanacetum cinerariifolium TaxID=118510 RepID=A0A699GYN4_TANCI|nr:hypothetical protein [Tanacetum cinerariifolium]
MESVKMSIDKRTIHKREYDSKVNERKMQTAERKIDTCKALDASLVDKESSGTESKEQDTSSRSGNDAHADDADNRPIYNEEPMAEEMILNGDSPPPTRIVDGVVQIIAPTTAEKRLAKKNKLKARGTLLMALLYKHQLKFNIHKDDKSLIEAIENRFGGNKETKKVQKTLLKQQYENFSSTRSKSIDQIHDMLQKLISQLEILGKTISQEDISLKFLISLTSEWKTHTLIWRNKADLKEQSLNVNAAPSISVSSSKATVSTLLNVDSLSDAVIYSFFASRTNSPQLDNEDLKQIDPDDLEEIDLKWQMGMLTMRVRRFLKRTGRNLEEAILPRNVDHQGTTGTKKLLEDLSQQRDNALAELRKKFEKAEQERNDLKLTLDKFQTSSKNLSKLLESQVSDKTGLGFNSQVFDYEELHSHDSNNSVPKNPENDRYKTGEGYHVVHLPYTGTFMPSKLDLVFADDPNASESVANMVNVESSTNKPSKDMSKTHRSDAPIIKDWISDTGDETKIEYVLKQREPSFVPPSEHVKTSRESVKKVKHHKQDKNLKKDNLKFRDCDHYEKQMVQQPMWNSEMRVNHKNSIRMIHPHSNRNVVPTTVLTRSRLVSFNAARPVPTAIPQSTVKSPRPVKHVVNKAYSPIRRLINHRPTTKNSNFNKKVTTVMVNKVNVVQGTKGNAEKAVANWTLKKSMEDMLHLEEILKVLPDENHVLLRVPRENNMYNVDLKNVVLAKATLDEFNL